MACFVAVGLMAAGSLALTDLPARWVPNGAAMLLAWTAWRAARELRKAPGTLVIRGDGTGATWVDARGSVELVDLTVGWRGAMATLAGRDPAGKLRHLAWWPDTLPPPARRALRLATGRPAATRVPLLST